MFLIHLFEFFLFLFGEDPGFGHISTEILEIEKGSQTFECHCIMALPLLPANLIWTGLI